MILVFFNHRREQIIITKEFDSEQHFSNYVAYMQKRYGYQLDEVYNK